MGLRSMSCMDTNGDMCKDLLSQSGSRNERRHNGFDDRKRRIRIYGGKGIPQSRQAMEIGVPL